jgi:anti-sigma regulatory factor (Ser/Thr protein kinase)
MVDTALWSHTQTFPAEAQSAFLARRFVGRHLLEHGLAHLIADVELVTSELATNALVHTRKPFTLSLEHNARAVVVRVQDCSPSVLVMGVPRVMDTHGRGLFLVDSISHEWGVAEESDGAASVWASFRTV